MIETLQDAAYQQMQAEVSQMTASSQLPEAQEQALDEYPMPDEQVSAPDMQEYGYFYDGMLPVTRERALELDAAGLTIYVLHEDNTESWSDGKQCRDKFHGIYADGFGKCSMFPLCGCFFPFSDGFFLAGSS